MAKRKRPKSERKWDELSDYIKREIDEKNLNAFGLLSIVEIINGYRKIYGKESMIFEEIRNVSVEISCNIQNNLKRYNKEALNCLTYCVTGFENQKSLFKFDQPYTSSLSPENYFEKELFAKIINLDKSNDINIDITCSWIVEYIKNALKSDEYDVSNNVFNICVYFLTFFALALMLNYDIDEGYDRYHGVIDAFPDDPEVRFLLYHILHSILLYYAFVKSIYFKNTKKDIQNKSKKESTIKNLYEKKFIVDYNNENFDKVYNNFTKKIKCNFYILNKIVCENYHKTHSEKFCFVDSMYAEEIVVKKFNEDTKLYKTAQDIIKEL